MTANRKQILSAVSIVSAGLFLTGCSWNKDVEQTPAVKSEKIATVQQQTAISENREMLFAKELVNNKDCVRAFQIFQKYAAEGDPEAEAWLGRCYMNGIGTAIDRKKSYEFFAKAAAKNNPWAVNGLGVCTQYGFGTAVNLQTAMDLYKKAADMKHPLGTINLARTYADKEGGFFDATMAEVYFKKAIELNAPSAKSAYASFLYDAKRYKEAVPLLMQSLDEPQSMWMMAMCYQNGWGTAVDISKAVDLAEKHFKKVGPAEWSAELCFNAGLEELIMNGVTDEVKRRFKYSAEQGHTEGQYSYAFYLQEAKDYDNALYYLVKSAEKDYYLAMLDAGKIFVDRKDFTNAIKYYTLATVNKLAKWDAIGNLSNIYHYHLKIPKYAVPWDTWGTELGIDVCRNEMAVKELLLNGDEHFAKAAALFAEGRITGNEFASQWLDSILKNDYDRLRSIADKKNSDALLALGIIGCLEEKGHPNINIGIELLEESAKLNNATACKIIGNLYRNGILVNKDVKKAFSWYQKSAELGNAESAKIAAILVFYDDALKDVKLDDIKKTFEKALELEEFSVAYEYGQIMELVAKDAKKAEELYRLAAAFDDGRAMIRLHQMLFETNQKEAFDFLWQAVALRDKDAELMMGDIQRILENPRSAFMYYLKAYFHGEKVNAPYRLAECWLNGYGCEANLTCFWNGANEAYKNGCVEVCYLLGSVYREGKICAKDMATAKAYFEEGAKRGSENCKKALQEFK